MPLFYDPRDLPHHQSRRSLIPSWLRDLGARPLSDARPEDPGFLFTGARPIEDYQRLLTPYPLIRDRPEERAPLLSLDSVLAALTTAEVAVPTPRTWRFPLDAPLPDDLTFPLFLRTAHSSLKLGGQASKVHNPRDLEAEAAELRRLLGWDAVILARQWCDFRRAGSGVHGPIPQEIRVWVVDGRPRAWSFHYLNVLPSPKGFPPSDEDVRHLADLAAQVAAPFASRLLVADFARTTAGGWTFIEAGPGSCAGTAHEAVFKAVAACLEGDQPAMHNDAVGGVITI